MPIRHSFQYISDTTGFPKIYVQEITIKDGHDGWAQDIAFSFWVAALFLPSAIFFFWDSVSFRFGWSGSFPWRYGHSGQSLIWHRSTSFFCPHVHSKHLAWMIFKSVVFVMSPTFLTDHTICHSWFYNRVYAWFSISGNGFLKQSTFTGIKPPLQYYLLKNPRTGNHFKRQT